MIEEAKLRAFFARDRFCKENGVEIESVSPERAVVRVEIEERHLNASNGVQGGLIFTLSDLAFALLANAEGLLTVSQSASVSFLRGAKGKTLRAIAQPLHTGKRTCACLVTVTDGGETPVATVLHNGCRLGVNPEFCK